MKMDDLQRNNRHCIKRESVPRKLCELDEICLSEIFKHLDISDLVVLTVANLTDHKNLDQAFTVQTSPTTHPYETSIRNRFLQLGYTDCITNNPDCILFEKTVFRYFGSLLSAVRLYYDHNYQRHNAKIEQVITDYGKMLSGMELINADTSAFESIKEPFVNLANLKFEGGRLGKTFLELSKWFPNLMSLTLNGTKISAEQFFKQEHPKLVELSVKNNNLCRCNRSDRNVFGDDGLEFSVNNLQLKRFLDLNGQLNSLTLYHDAEDAIFERNMQPYQFLIQINFDLLRFIANTLLRLYFLKLNITKMLSMYIPPYQTTFLRLRTLIVEASNTNQLTQLNIVSTELHHLEMTIHSPIDNYKALAAFVRGFKNIEYLSIGHHPVTLHDENFVRMIKDLHSLRILRISLYKFNFSGELCYIIQNFDHLLTIKISCMEIASTDRQSFVDYVNGNFILKNSNWTGVCIDNEFEFKKV